MYETVSCWSWTKVCTLAWLCVWIWRYYWLVFVIMSPWCVVQIQCIQSSRWWLCACLHWMYETVSTGVVLALDEQEVHTFFYCSACVLTFDGDIAIQWLWGRNLITLVCCSNALKKWWRWQLCIRWINVLNGAVLALDEQKVRLHCCLFEFEGDVSYWCVFDTVWGCNLTLMLCRPNVLLHALAMMAFLCWFLCVACASCGTMVYWPWTNRRCICLYCCVFEFEGVVGRSLMQYEVTPVPDPHVLCKYHTMAMTALRCWSPFFHWMHGTNGVLYGLVPNEQFVRLYGSLCTWIWRCWCLMCLMQ